MRRSFWLGLILALALWLCVVVLALTLVVTVAACYTHLLPFPTSPACVEGAWLRSWVPWASLIASAIVVGGTALSGWRYLQSQRRGTRRFLTKLLAARADAGPELSALAARSGVDRLEVVDIEPLLAITRGYLRPTVVVSRGLLESMADAELSALLAHEAAHVRRHDPLRKSIGRIVAAAMWPFPVVGDIVDHAETAAEVTADTSALRSADRRSLLRGLTTMHGWAETSEDVAVSSACGRLDARLEFLATGEAPGLDVPRRSATISGMSLAILAVVTAALVTAAARVGILA